PVEEEGEDRGGDQGVGEDTEDTGALLPELVEAAAVEEAGHVGLALAGGEEAHEQGADDAADEVDADDVEGVVVVEAVLQADGHGAQDTGDETDRDGAERGDRAAGGGDGDQAGDGAGGGAQGGEGAVAELPVGEPAEDGGAGGGLGVEDPQGAAAGGGDGDQAGDGAGGGAQGGEGAVADLLVGEPAEDGGAGGHLGVDEHQRADAVVVAEPRAGVEAEPAEPQQGGAEHDQREAV